MKHCPKCKVDKDESQYHADRHKASGLAVYCKACDNAARRARALRNHEAYLATQKAWYAKNADAHRARVNASRKKQE